MFSFNRVIFDENGKYITDRKIIAKKYLKGWFIVDFISFLPINLMFNISEAFNHEIKIIKIYRIIHLIRCFRLVKLMKGVQIGSKNKQIRSQYMGISTTFDHLSSEIFLSILFVHLFTCLMYYIPVTISPDNNWAVAMNITELPFYKKYLICLHWVVQTFTTVGYGSIPLQ